MKLRIWKYELSEPFYIYGFQFKLLLYMARRVS